MNNAGELVPASVAIPSLSTTSITLNEPSTRLRELSSLTYQPNSIISPLARSNSSLKASLITTFGISDIALISAISINLTPPEPPIFGHTDSLSMVEFIAAQVTTGSDLPRLEVTLTPEIMPCC